MNNKDLFNTPQEEVSRLIAELRDTKAALREVAGTLSRIETRVKRAFPAAFPKSAPKEKTSAKPDQHPSITVEAAMKLYGELVELAKSDGAEPVRNRLATLSLPDLALLRRELGVSLGKRKSSVKSEVEAILGRLSESIMLSQHTNRQAIIDRAESEE